MVRTSRKKQVSCPQHFKAWGKHCEDEETKTWHGYEWWPLCKMTIYLLTIFLFFKSSFEMLQLYNVWAHIPHSLSPGICDSHLGEFCQVLCLNHSSTTINQSEERIMNGSPVVLWGLLGLLLHAATLTHNYILTLIVDFTLVMSASALLLTL